MLTFIYIQTSCAVLNSGISLADNENIALYNDDCPKHLQLEFHISRSYNLRSSAAPLSMASPSFNSLPDNVRQLTDYFSFVKETRKFLF